MNKMKRKQKKKQEPRATASPLAGGLTKVKKKQEPRATASPKVKLKKDPLRVGLKVKKKQKKQFEYSPVFININRPEPQFLLMLRLAVKFLMICLSAAGLGITLANIYKIPVSAAEVMTVCFSAVIGFNIILLYFKKRIFFIPAILILLFANREGISSAIFLFWNHLLLTLDGRLLSTARYAYFTPGELLYWHNARAIAQTFLVICVLFSFMFTLAARSRYIGVILGFTVFIITPAFGAEIAGYVEGMNILGAGLLGLYAMWAAHAWENIGGLHQINYDDFIPKNPSEQSEQSEQNNAEKSSNPARSPEPIHKVTPGKRPHFYKYGRNSLAAVALVLTAFFIAETLVPHAVKFDYRKFVDLAYDIQSLVPAPIRQFFKHNFGSINDNGYFPNISSDISTGISMNRPPNGNIPIIKVHVEDNSEKIYLRGGIGIDLEGDKWTVVQDSHRYELLLQLLEDFTPEKEYHVYSNVLDLLSGNFGLSHRPSDLIGRQEVRIEYLSRTGFLLLPTMPYDDDFKTNSDYTVYGDTYIKPTRRMSSTTFDTYYLKLGDFGLFNDVYSTMLLTRGLQEWYERNTLVDLISVIDEEKLREYQYLINQIYTRVPDGEYENIEKFLFESGAFDYFSSSAVMIHYGNSDRVTTNALAFAQYINLYLRENYSYSLTVNNYDGDNTAIGTFLHDTREGHCAMYASSMVMAMRYMGFPARYVTGIVTVANDGTPSPYGYEHTIAERDFHAWVEVYIEGIGWVPFDPTGGAHGQEQFSSSEVPGANSEVPVTTPEETTPLIITTPDEMTSPPESVSDVTAVEPSETTDETAGNSGSKLNLRLIGGIAVVVFIVGGGIAAVSAYLRRLRKSEERKFARFKSGGSGKGGVVSYNKTAEEMYRFMFKLLEAEGIHVTAGEPPLDFAKKVDSQLPQLESVSLERIMPVFEKMEFADVNSPEIILTHAEYASLYEYVAALYEKTVTEKKTAERLVLRHKYRR